MKKRIICILSAVLMVLMLFPATAFAASKAEKTYDKAQDALIDGKYEKAAELFESVSGYEDAAQCALYAKALWYGSEEKYDDALKTLTFLGDFKDSVQLINYFTICRMAKSTKLGDIFDAAEQFDDISAYRDSAKRAEECRQSLYDEAVYRFNTGDFDTAKWIYTELGSYKDSAEQVQVCDRAISEKKNTDAYTKAESLLEQKKFDEAEAAFRALGDYSDSSARVEEVIEARNADAYTKAEGLLEQKKFDEAEAAFRALGDYSDSSARVEEVIEARNTDAYTKAEGLLEQKNFDEAEAAFRALGDYKDSKDKITEVQSAKKEAAYQDAMLLYTKGDYTGAYAAFTELSGYKDVDTLLKTDENLLAAAVAVAAAAREAKLAAYKKVRNKVTFGTYEQDNNTANGKEDIEWLVLANEGNRSLLISCYALDSQEYKEMNRDNITNIDTTWEKCDLRTWLNGTFLNAAFSTDEQKAILTTSVDNSKSQGYSSWSTSGGNDTKDQIFLLSYAEAEKYFRSREARICKPTAYADDQVLYTNKSGNCSWWLRSPGFTQDCAMVVDVDGSFEHECRVSDLFTAVRPAFWINLESDIF